MTFRVARHVTSLVLLAVLVSACGAPAANATPGGAATMSGQRSGSVQLTVFAAASLTASFTEIGKGFEVANPGSSVAFNFAGSNDLAAQISKGAPADVFASANDAQMAAVVKAGHVGADAVRTFARNRLVVIYPVANPAKLQNLQDLARPGVKVVLAAKEVPVGQYALDFLTKASRDPTFGPAYQDAVVKNVVSYEQDVKAVLSKVALGEADAGVVYATDVTPDAATKVGRIAIPDALNTIASYPIAPITSTTHAALAKKFVDYVLAAEGQSVLAKYGFVPVSGGSVREVPAAVPLASRRRGGNA